MPVARDDGTNDKRLHSSRFINMHGEISIATFLYEAEKSASPKSLILMFNGMNL